MRKEKKQMYIDVFMDEVKKREHLSEKDVRALASEDPERLWRLFLTVKSTLEPDPECVEMDSDMEREIARMRENSRHMAEYCAMMDFHEPEATVRSIVRALDDGDLSIDEIYEGEKEEEDDE